MNEIVTVIRMPGVAPALPSVSGIDIFGALLADARSPATREAREHDMRDLARFLGVDGPGRAAELLISGTAGQANAVALGYARRMADRGLAPASRNRRLSTLRRLVKLARRLGLVEWALDCDSARSEPYRDTAGPGHPGWLAMLAVAAAEAGRGSARGRRDLAMLRLMHDSGLRRGEVLALDLADVDLEGRRVAIVGKGHSERRWWTVNRATADALAAWIAARASLGPSRGQGKGPLFVRLDAGASAGDGPGRLTGYSVFRIVRKLGRQAGLARDVRPHGLRHAGATLALDLFHSDIRKVQRWTRHRKLDTVAIYDDQRMDVAGEVTDRLGEVGS